MIAATVFFITVPIGLDRDLCECRRITETIDYRIFNGVRVRNGDLKWLGNLYVKYDKLTHRNGTY